MNEINKEMTYYGFGKNTADTAYIEKARPLQSLAKTDLTLPEFKILDAYLSRIDSHNPEKRTVKLEKGELERFLGVTEIKKSDLEKRLQHLFQVIKINDDKKQNGFKLINLFEEADAEQDENGLWQVTLTCTPPAREYIFNLENIGYLRYRLKNVVNLTSRYSYVLFLYLLDNRFRGTWNIELSNLKQLLNCTAERYNQFKFFNSEILKRCHNELLEKTDLIFEYRPLKKGRRVSSIEFTVKTIKELQEEQPEQLAFNLNQEIETEQEINYGGELANLLGSVTDDEFTPEQIRVLQDLIIKAVNGDNLHRCDYLLQQYHKMNLYDTKNQIKNRFSYLCRMIEKDIN